MNGLGQGCKKGSDCNKNQVCNASTKNCFDCEQGVTTPDEDKAKCVKIQGTLPADMFGGTEFWL